MKIKHLLIIIFLFVLGTIFIIGNFKNNNIYNNKEEVKNNSSIAIMVENGLDSGVYEKITTNKWPKEGYKFNKELSKCDNGSIINYDSINRAINLTGKVTDKCYVYFDAVVQINFYLQDNEYQADEGMTLAEWINSKYNTFGYIFDSIGSYNVNKVVINNNASYYIYSRDFSLYEVIDADGTVNNNFKLNYYSENKNNYFNEGNLYDKNFLHGGFLQNNLGYDYDSKYKSSLPLVLYYSDYDNVNEIENYKTPFTIFLETVYNNFIVMYYSHADGLWHIVESNYVAGLNRLSFDVFDYYFGDPILILYK